MLRPYVFFAPLPFLTFEQTDGAVQAFDSRAEVFARARRQLSD